jgi:hypothetical protein
VPDSIRYFEPTGASSQVGLAGACRSSRYPAELSANGFFSFGTLPEINEAFASVGKFTVKQEFPLMAFVQEGSKQIGKQDASNMVHSMFRQAWNLHCRERGLLEYQYSKDAGFHASTDQAKIGQKIPWGKQGDRRSSMLLNVAKGHVWQFGVTALPSFWPFPHLKLKSRVLFAPLIGDKAGDPYDDAKKQHRLRRSVCKGWRNKQWHGRIMAFIELLSGEASSIILPLGGTANIRLEAAPVLFTSPVSTILPNKLDDDQEEQDDSTLGRPEPEEEP